MRIYREYDQEEFKGTRVLCEHHHDAQEELGADLREEEGDQVDARERAAKWLIEYNHHGCHLDVHPEAGMPLPADVDALAALLADVDAESQRYWSLYWSPADDVLKTLESLARVDGAHVHPTREERARLGAWLDAVRKPLDRSRGATGPDGIDVPPKHGA